MESLETSFEQPKDDQMANDVAPAPRTQDEDYAMRMGDSGPYPDPSEWN